MIPVGRNSQANLPQKIEIRFWGFGLAHKLHGLHIFFDQQYIRIPARNAEHYLLAEHGEQIGIYDWKNGQKLRRSKGSAKSRPVHVYCYLKLFDGLSYKSTQYLLKILKLKINTPLSQSRFLIILTFKQHRQQDLIMMIKDMFLVGKCC
jgi:hypothetical protein